MNLEKQFIEILSLRYEVRMHDVPWSKILALIDSEFQAKKFAIASVVDAPRNFYIVVTDKLKGEVVGTASLGGDGKVSWE